LEQVLTMNSQKRYERMLKANGVSTKPVASNNAGSDDKGAAAKSSPTKRKPASELKPKKPAKKGKKEESDSDSANNNAVKKQEAPVKHEDDESVLSGKCSAPSVTARSGRSQLLRPCVNTLASPYSSRSSFGATKLTYVFGRSDPPESNFGDEV
jgi:phage repressor protein C with HTH and peptisase S24 domain